MSQLSGSRSLPRWWVALAVLALALARVGPACAQADDPAQHLEDFVFYALTANPELASANGQALLDAGLSDAEIAQLLDEGEKTTVERFDSAVARAQNIPDPELQNIAAELAMRIEQGRLDLARDPQRIEDAITMLVGTQRQRLIAQRRLASAGEYAVPSLLRQVTEGKDERLKNQCITVLQEIGRQAVSPLCAALVEVGDPVSQRVVCDILGAIGHPHAGPTLSQLSQDGGASQPVREAAARAFRRVVPVQWEGMSLASLYAALGLRYFNESESLIAFPFEPTNNVWSYDPFVGLMARPVPTEVFSEIMAMRSAAAALKIDPAHEQALSLFVASDLKRENELPAGAVDPIFGQNRFTPDFYATVFGTATCQNVLAMAIDNVNTPLVRDAIRALSQTTGGSNLFDGSRDREPLLEALQYPDRRTQFEAALTLARVLPDQHFPSDFAVVPLLASAVRTGDKTFALVVCDDEEDRRVLSNMLEGLNFEIVGADAAVANLQGAILEAIGVDLAVVKLRDADSAVRAIDEMRLIPKTTATPVLLQAGALDIPRLRPEYRGDRRVHVSRAGVDETQFEAQVDAVMAMGSGGRMTEAEAQEYAIDALAALRDIAIARPAAYDIADAEAALLEALDVRRGGTRLLVADILALIDADRAQRSLFDAALAAEGSEQIDLLDRVAASVKRYGDRAEQRHVDALVDLILNSAGNTAEAAARVHGALNLPNQDVVRLIP